MDICRSNVKKTFMEFFYLPNFIIILFDSLIYFVNNVEKYIFKNIDNI